MKNRYSLTAMLSIVSLSVFSQTSYPIETVGTPASPALVTAYTGWTNNGVLTFSGNAQVDNTNSSNNLSASGGGNVVFTNVVGTNLQISGFAPSGTPASMDITFDMYGYTATNLSELVLEYSTDGISWTPLTYKRLFRNYMPPTPWDVMISDPLPGSTNFTALKIRFRQTTSTKTFRIDDVQATFYTTLPIKLISFSGAGLKSDVHLNWKASSTDEHEYFVVERSKDGRNFTELGAVQVKGIGEFTYNFTDKPYAEKTFYRLKLVDVAGRSTHSQILFVQLTNNNNDVIQAIYPNPARQVLNTQLLSTRQEKAVLTLTDLSGRIVMSQGFSLQAGYNNCALDVQKLNGGMYILRIVTAGITETKSILVQ